MKKEKHATQITFPCFLKIHTGSSRHVHLNKYCIGDIMRKKSHCSKEQRALIKFCLGSNVYVMFKLHDCFIKTFPILLSFTFYFLSPVCFSEHIKKEIYLLCRPDLWQNSVQCSQFVYLLTTRRIISGSERRTSHSNGNTSSMIWKWKICIYITFIMEMVFKFTLVILFKACWWCYLC